MFSKVIRSAFSIGIAAVVAAAAAAPGLADTPAQKRENIHRCLLQIYLSQRKSEAGGEYLALLAAKPSDAQLHYDYGNFLLRGGNAGGSAAQYQAAIKYAPRNADYQIGLGNALMRTKNYKGAVAAYRRAVEIGGATGSQSPQQLLGVAQQYVQQQEAYENYKKQQAENQ
ncbi:MAG TPA: tetratricopeptide repeat protein [Drouetiella sp.]|jgi:tetratricopeptide (TPR) repeat protein